MVMAVLMSACNTETVATDVLPAGLQEQVDTATGIQREILEDGSVMPAELEQAFLAAIACIEAEGVTVTNVVIDEATASYQHEVVYGEDDAMRVRALAVSDRCMDENFNLVLNYAAFVHAPSQLDVQEHAGRIARCLEERGFVVPDHSPEGVAAATAEGEAAIAYGECFTTTR